MLFACSAIALLSVSLASCNQARDSATNTASSTTDVADAGHTHGEWWCSEHGVPEEVCALCNTTLVADFKAKSDWCDEHNRPDSQCFICHPEKQAEFAALYEAKYGHQPPELGTAGGDHDHDHDG
jgi:cobalt-zinc-cadmium efflux system membrane fusion protein